MRGARLAFVALLTAATATSHSLELPDDGRFTFVRLRWAGGPFVARLERGVEPRLPARGA